MRERSRAGRRSDRPASIPQRRRSRTFDTQATPIAIDPSTGAVVTLASVPAYAVLTLDGGTSSVTTTNRSFILVRRAP
jgi:hypothetical protein